MYQIYIWSVFSRFWFDYRYLFSALTLLVGWWERDRPVEVLLQRFPQV